MCVCRPAIWPDCELFKNDLLYVCLHFALRLPAAAAAAAVPTYSGANGRKSAQKRMGVRADRVPVVLHCVPAC